MKTIRQMTKQYVIKFALALGVCAWTISWAQPMPGDIFKEYIWAPSGFPLRVGGSLDYGGGNISISGFDLTNAIKAEINIQKLLCHDGTIGLSISVNDNQWIVFPEADKIPVPQCNYQYMIYPTVELPVSQLKAGTNQFKLKVDPNHSWGWPQNLIYGVLFRVYYSSQKSHPKGEIASPAQGANLGLSNELTAKLEAGSPEISKVEYIGYYEDFNYEGDGEYLQWHYHFFRNQIVRHLGTGSRSPAFPVLWKTDWIPDQKQPMKIMARLVGNDGTITMTPAVDGLTLFRAGHGVEMCKPYEVPALWVTRRGEKSEKFDIKGDYELSKAKAARMVWVSWSGCYSNGIFINNNLVIGKATESCYDYDFNVVSVPLNYLKKGTNVLKTAAGPSGVHGMEVNWPGIVVFVQHPGEPGGVIISPLGGEFDDSVTVTLKSSQASYVIHYTTDGSMPTRNSPKYTGAIVLKSTCTLKVRAYAPNYADSSFVLDAKFKITLSLQPTNPAGTEPGLAYHYYEGSWSQLPQFDQLVPSENGTIEQFTLPLQKATDHFGVLYEGYIEISTAGLYTFSLLSDAGSKLYLDSYLIVDNDGGGGGKDSGKVKLQTGKYPIRVAYFEDTGMELLKVRYAGPGISTTEIPSSVLSHDPKTVSVIRNRGSNPTKKDIALLVWPNGWQYPPGQAFIRILDIHGRLIKSSGISRNLYCSNAFVVKATVQNQTHFKRVVLVR